MTTNEKGFFICCFGTWGVVITAGQSDSRSCPHTDLLSGKGNTPPALNTCRKRFKAQKFRIVNNPMQNTQQIYVQLKNKE